MKKIIFFVACSIIFMATQTTAQSVRRVIFAEFVAGTISIPHDTICAYQVSQQISGTAATGGNTNTMNSYQWQIWSNSNPVWSNLLGAVGLNLQTGSLAPGQYEYRRIDTNPGCGSTDTTNIITVHVWGIFLAGIATGGGNFCDGDMGTATTCTPATGGDPSIVQEVQTSPDGTIWTNTGNMTLSYTPIGPLTDDIYVRWQFSNSCDTVYSNIILYNVYDPFVAGAASTTTISPICNGVDGGTATATAATGGAPSTTMEWETSTDGITYSNTGNVSLAYSFGILTVPTWTRLRYMNDCDTLYSNILFIDVYTVLTNGGLSVLIGNDTICFNTDPGTIDAPAATGGSGVYNYQWRQQINGGAWANIPGATNEDYDIPVLSIAGTHLYQRMVTDACETIYGDIVTVYVYQTFDPGVIGYYDEVCSGTQQANIIEITPATGGSGIYTYQWILSNDDITFAPIPGANGTTYTPPIISTPVMVEQFYRRVVTNLCGTAESGANN